MTRTGRKLLIALKWLPSYVAHAVMRNRTIPPLTQVVLALADHFEPYIMPLSPGSVASLDVQMRRTTDWISRYEKVFDNYRDSDGVPLRHTYFFPGEHYHPGILELLSEHCARGWGEVEVHLHHGLNSPDTPEQLRSQLLWFRDKLVEHGCLSRLDGMGEPRYAFVHGNFTLANSGQGNCGVDSELQVLADTGCYADFTLPSWPNPAQIAKINSLYECYPPLGRRAAHKRGRDLTKGSRPILLPVIVEGPLMLDFSKRKYGIIPVIDNSALTNLNPPSRARLRLWMRARIRVQDQPNWLFIKLHCHGMDERDTPMLLGNPMLDFLSSMAEMEKQNIIRTHFVTAREMTNIIFAACDGREGCPSEFRDYRLRPISAKE